MRNDDGKALSRQAYYEATEPVRMLVFVRQRECQITDYDSRRTADGLLDRGSTPLRSTKLRIGENKSNDIVRVIYNIVTFYCVMWM